MNPYFWSHLVRTWLFFDIVSLRGKFTRLLRIHPLYHFAFCLMVNADIFAHPLLRLLTKSCSPHGRHTIQNGLTEMEEDAWLSIGSIHPVCFASTPLSPFQASPSLCSGYVHVSDTCPSHLPPSRF